MNKDEKIEVMFESILAELEKLTKALQNSTNLSNDDSETFKILEAINKLGDKISDQEESIDLGDLERKMESIKEAIESKGNSFIAKEKHHHYFWFFPDLKEWFGMISRAKFTWFLAVILVISLGFNYYFGKDYQSIQDANNKYDYLKFSDQPISTKELDSLWQDENWRGEKMEFLESERDKAFTEEEKEKRLEELRKELHNLEREEPK
ncbi:MAG: hypothetical protein RIM99_12165 [Cyclobacteriaceae bacterium]